MTAFIYDIVRTPRGKGSPRGALAGVKPVELVASLMTELCRRHDAAKLLDDVLLGCVTATAEQGANLAKIAALYAGLPAEISGMTLSRFCASSISALAMAGLQVSSGGDRLVLAGGVESMSRVPMFSDGGAWFSDPEVAERTGFVHMGVSADLLAMREGIQRPGLEAYALRSHRLASRARDEGRFTSSIPVRDHDGSLLLDRDEAIRDGLDAERLASLEPAFGDAIAEAADRLRSRHGLESLEPRHTVATSPALADAASLALIGGSDAGDALGRRPRARLLSSATASVEPTLMLTGNVEATRRALGRAGMTIADVDVFEVNESFAVVPLHYQRSFELDDEQLNPNGGAIAMGHPLGATGAILAASALEELERVDGNVAVACVCGGAGVAAALVLERVG